MSAANGKYDSIEALAAAVKKGDVQFRAAPKITRVIIPQIQIRADDRRAGLALALENIKRRKEAARNAKAVQQEEIRQFRDWMWGVALPFIRDVDDYLENPEVGPDILAEPYVGREDNKEISIGQQRDEFRNDIDQYQKCDDLNIALNLVVAESVFWVSAKELTHEELSDQFLTLIANKVLEENVKGSIESPKGVRFSLHPRFDLLDGEEKQRLADDIRTATDNQVHRIRKEAQQTRIEADQRRVEIQERLLETHKLRPVDIFWDVDGIYPLTTVEGFLLVKAESDGNIVALEAGGCYQLSYDRLKELETRYGKPVQIDRSSLKNSSGLLRCAKNPPEIQVPKEVSREDFKFWVAAGRFLWHVCREALSKELGEELQERKFDLESSDLEDHGKKRPARKFTQRALDRNEFHEKHFVGYYELTTIERWSWWITDPSGKCHEEVVGNLFLKLERFKTDSGEIRLRVVEHSPEHKEFLEKIGCLDPKGYLDIRGEGCELEFLEKIMEVDYKLSSR